MRLIDRDRELAAGSDERHVRVGRIHEHEGLSLRVWQSLPAERLPELAELKLRSRIGDDFLRLGYVKAFIDGTLGSQTALMLDGSGVQITPGSPDSPFLVATADTPVPVIQADSGSGQGVFEAGSAALNNANVFISKLNALLDQNEKSINTLKWPQHDDDDQFWINCLLYGGAVRPDF